MRNFVYFNLHDLVQLLKFYATLLNFKQFCKSLCNFAQLYTNFCIIAHFSPTFTQVTKLFSSKLSKELKNCIKIWVGQAVFELLIKTKFWLFWSIDYKLLRPTEISMPFEFFGQFALRCMYYFFQRKGCLFWASTQNMLILSYGRRTCLRVFV